MSVLWRIFYCSNSLFLVKLSSTVRIPFSIPKNPSWMIGLFRMWTFFRVQRTLIRRYPKEYPLRMKKNFSPLVTRYYFLDEIFSNQVPPMKIISSTNNWIVFTRLINKEKKLLLLSINITLGSLIKKKPQNRKIISITSQIFDLESNYIIKLSYFSTVRINRNSRIHTKE